VPSAFQIVLQQQTGGLTNLLRNAFAACQDERQVVVEVGHRGALLQTLVHLRVLSVFVKTGQFVLGTARETLAVDWVEKN
jgi:hypothetical protein